MEKEVEIIDSELLRVKVEKHNVVVFTYHYESMKVKQQCDQIMWIVIFGAKSIQVNESQSKRN